MAHVIKNITDKIYPLSRQSLELIESELMIEEYNKKELIIESDSWNRKEYFILEGICRSFLINPLFEETTLSFYTDNTVVTPNLARTVEGKSLYNLQALTSVRLASISVSVFEQMRIDHEEIRNFGQTVMRNELIKKVDKEMGLAALTASDRLIKFRDTYPMLENLIPHPHIASYLGITNITLSRLRKNLSGT